ncbi:MAG: Gfo/Idh/MocA family oxidoreductase [Planctomycetales bacterium]|nr:Gfo/Idh/MocA family oxidoreductase [Planctomycetales bacterium]
MSVLRLAVIGAGHLGRIHAKLAASNEQFEVVSVVDPIEQSRQLIAQELHLPTAADYRELLGKIDAAIVATPTVMHYEVTSDLLRSGAHVLVEKPLAHTSDQAQRLVHMAQSHRRVLQVGHVERFNPIWTATIPQLGKPKYIEAVRSGKFTGRSTDIGAVLDLMIHDLDLILSIDSSPVEQIAASGLAVLGSTEDIAEARIEFASGLIATLRASRLATEATRKMQVFGTQGYAELNFSAAGVNIIKPSEDVIFRRIALDRMTATERLEIKDQVYDKFFEVETVHAQSRNAILDEQNDFALSILSGTQPVVSGADGARAVQVASEILTCIAGRGWDGKNSRPWRMGAGAMIEPAILPLPAPAAIEQPMRKAS